MNRQIDGHGAPEGPMDPDRAGFLRRREVWAVLALAAIVRVAYWASKWNDRLLFNDSLYYSGQAIKMFHGQWFRDPFFDLPAADHGPVTTLLMAPLSGGSDPWRWQRLITVMTGLVLVAVVMRWTTEMVSRRAGIAAGILAALYPNLWMNDGLVMSESVALAFLVTASWLAWRALRQWEGGPRALRSWWSAGAVFGLAALTRSEIALIAVVVVTTIGFAAGAASGAGAASPTATFAMWRITRRASYLSNGMTPGATVFTGVGVTLAADHELLAYTSKIDRLVL